MSAGILVGVLVLSLFIILIGTSVKKVTPFDDISDEDIVTVVFSNKEMKKKIVENIAEQRSIAKYLRSINTEKMMHCNLDGPIYNITITTKEEKKIMISFFYTKIHYLIEDIPTGKIEIDEWYKGHGNIIIKLRELYKEIS